MIREIHYNQVFDPQRHYRKILDSMARPGKVNSLPQVPIFPPAGISHAAAWVGFSLLNAEVQFFTHSPEVTAYLVANTQAKATAAGEADFLFLAGDGPTEPVLAAQTGEPEYPETGAFIVLEVEALSNTPLPGSLCLTLQGPGIENSRKLWIRGVDVEILSVVNQKNAEYPLGIDIIMTDTYQQIACIPRSSQLQW